MDTKDLPKELLYNQDYSWIKIDGEIAKLGIISPAAKRVKEFVFIKLPELGQQLKPGDIYASLEALKWSGHLSSPLSGEVIEVNQPLFDEPSIINKDAYGEGWIAKIKITNKEELEKLIKAEKASEWFNSLNI